jgi:hypothetical protein
MRLPLVFRAWVLNIWLSIRRAKAFISDCVSCIFRAISEGHRPLRCLEGCDVGDAIECGVAEIGDGGTACSIKLSLNFARLEGRGQFARKSKWSPSMCGASFEARKGSHIRMWDVWLSQ